jgi:hypothetical protein
MCFSAGASFGAGILLSGIGVASIKKTNRRHDLLFAAIPLIFAAQQVTEGFLWLSLTNTSFSALKSPTTYLFLFFAQVVWPVFVPFSIYQLLQKKQQGIIPKVFVISGTVVSIYLGYCLISYPVNGSVLGKHISYDQQYPMVLRHAGGFLYFLATIGPAFMTKMKWMNLLGGAILLSYIMTEIFYEDYIISVWCFFASIISLVVYFVIRARDSAVGSQTEQTSSDT